MNDGVKNGDDGGGKKRRSDDAKKKKKRKCWKKRVEMNLSWNCCLEMVPIEKAGLLAWLDLWRRPPSQSKRLSMTEKERKKNH
jgi:hypothetical protein